MTSKEITHSGTELDLFNTLNSFAQGLSRATIISPQYRSQPGNALYAISWGHSLGLSPAQSLNYVNVINGKPTLTADAIAALVRKAGHKLRVTPGEDRVEVVIIRADDPDFEPKPVVWTMEKARQAGLLKNPAWTKYPGQMLRARAISEAARTWASDALAGVIYTPEEIQSTTSDTPEPDLGHGPDSETQIECEVVEEDETGPDSETPPTESTFPTIFDQIRELSKHLPIDLRQWAIAANNNQPVDRLEDLPEPVAQKLLTAMQARKLAQDKEGSQ